MSGIWNLKVGHPKFKFFLNCNEGGKVATLSLLVFNTWSVFFYVSWKWRGEWKRFSWYKQTP